MENGEVCDDEGEVKQFMEIDIGRDFLYGDFKWKKVSEWTAIQEGFKREDSLFFSPYICVEVV